VVGVSRNASGRSLAVLFRDGVGLADLNTLISPASGWTLQVARDISDTGLIVGLGMFGGRSTAFLLTPIPEPSSVFLTAVAMLAAVRIPRQLSRKTMRC
jgi:hypothetical protein